MRNFAQISLFKVLEAKILRGHLFFSAYRTLGSTFYTLNFKLLITMETQNPSETEPFAHFYKCAQFILCIGFDFVFKIKIPFNGHL